MKTVGLVGCGRWGQYILRDLLSTGTAVKVVCRSQESVQRALSLGAISASANIDDLADTDGIVVAVPTVSHASILERIMPFGTPIFVEKPLTADVESARRLAAIAGENRLFVMDKWRYHPVIEAMRHEIASGRVGEVLAIRLTRWGWANPHTDVNGLWILAPHDLSIVLHLLGDIPDVTQAAASIPNQPDLALTAVLQRKGMPTVTLDISIASPEHRRRCLVIGSEMTLELRDGYDDRLFVRRGAPGAVDAVPGEIEAGDAMPLLSEIQRFVGFLHGGPAPYSSAAEGLLIVQRLAEIEQRLEEQQ
jgi:predicted dehydrogenase